MLAKWKMAGSWDRGYGPTPSASQVRPPGIADDFRRYDRDFVPFADPRHSDRGDAADQRHGRIHADHRLRARPDGTGADGLFRRQLLRDRGNPALHPDGP